MTSGISLAHGAKSHYRAKISHRVLLLQLLVILSACAVLLDLITGPAGLPLSDVVIAIFRPHHSDSITQQIVWDIRLPTALMALLIGGGLALAGAEMQTILANPLAEPFTLGVSASAALGASLGIVLGIGLPGVPTEWAIPANAFVFALISLMLLQVLARLHGGGAAVLVLFGIAIGLFAGTALSVLQFIASPDTLQQIVFWSMGSLARADWSVLAILSVALAVTAPFSFAASWKLTALRLGEDRASSFGVNVPRLRFFALVRISLLAAAAVSFAGIIGFVGLVGPHIARMLVGDDHRFFLPASALIGAVVMSLASIASKAIVPGVLLPIGLVTSLVGLPIFVLLIVRSRGGGR